MKHRVIMAASIAITMLFAGLVMIYGPSPLQRFALALNNNYTNKTDGDQLTPAEWNFLDEDFVKKEGDTMTGALNMGNQRITGVGAPSVNTDAATRGYVDAQVAAGSGNITNQSGTSLRMVCGSTPQGNTLWDLYGSFPRTVQYTVPTNTGFTNTVQYITSLGGAHHHYTSYGVANVYNPTFDSFHVHVIYTATDAWSVDLVRYTYQWYVNWCAIGY